MKKGREDRWVRFRIWVILLVTVAAFSAILTRLFYLQVLRHGELAQKAERQHQKSVLLEPARGNIYDRAGRELAVSIDMVSIYGMISSIDNIPYTIKRLSSALGKEERDLQNILKERTKEGKNFVWLARKMPPSITEKVKTMKIKGIGYVTEGQRFYPKKHLSANVLGIAGLDNRGLEGVELRYDKYLRGDRESLLIERDALGKVVFANTFNHFGPFQGHNVVLTIDEVIQYISEKGLEEAIERSGARGGVIIVMNPKTGEILSLALKPGFNPNNIDFYKPEDRRNKAITDIYEPGSTFKVITAAAALEEKLVRPDDIINCENGVIRVAGSAIHDPFPQSLLTFQDVIVKSSNVGVVKVGLRIGEERFHRYVRSFGFGERTGIDLPGESQGILRSVDRWSRRSLSTISIGQEIAVTPLQLITAISAIANGGWLVRPYVVSEINDPAGRVIKKNSPEIVRRVISAGTSRTMTRILAKVTEKGGTAEKAAIPGYTVAGKTGTAQKIDPKTRKYSKDSFVSSFVGYAPAEDPAIAILVMIDEPKGVSWGGSVAAPVFRNIAGQVLNYLKIPPEKGNRALMLAMN